MKRKVWVAKISYYDQYVVEPEDMHMLMCLAQRMRRVIGHPPVIDTDDPAPLCSDIAFMEIEFPENEMPPLLGPTPPPEEF
jgi:hypothetical protein